MNKGRFVKSCCILSHYLLRISRNERLPRLVLKTKPLIKGSFLMVLPFLPVVGAISAQDEKKRKAKLIQLADDLYGKTQFGDLFDALRGESDSDDPELLWRLARATYEQSRVAESQQETVALLEAALGYTARALELNSNCWAAHKWRAILMDLVWRHKDTKGRIRQSYEIRTHIEKAIELNPQDSTSYYLLGEWCYVFADLPWYQRKIASVLFATPPTSTFEEAYSFFEKAEKIKPGFYSKNFLMLAKCQLKLNNKDGAVVFLQKVLDYPRKTQDDKEAHEEAAKLLKDIGGVA